MDALQQRNRARPGYWAGTSVMAFAATAMVGSVVVMLVLGGCTIDLLTPMVLLVGYRVRKQSAPAALVAAVLMGYYGAVSAGLAVIPVVGLPDVSVGGAKVELPAWSAAVFAGLAAWCGLTVLALLRARRELQREESARRGACRACGYDLTANVSGVCPECGTLTQSGDDPPAHFPQPGSGSA